MDQNEFPGNSRHPRQPAEKDIDQVVATPGVRRKKTLSRQAKDVFLGGDSRGVVQYVLFELLVPQIRETIVDVVTQGFERMVFGDNRAPRRGSSSGPTQYNKYARSNVIPMGSRPGSRQVRSIKSNSTDDILLATRAEAEEVLRRMYDLIERYEQVSVADVYSLVGITATHTDQKWGWRDLEGSGVGMLRGEGYILHLPTSEPLN